MRGQEAFVDIRVLTQSLTDTSMPHHRCHEINEKVKKPNCNNRILQIEHRTFTPLVFSIYGSMGRECTKLYSKITEQLSERKECKSLTVN